MTGPPPLVSSLRNELTVSVEVKFKRGAECVRVVMVFSICVRCSYRRRSSAVRLVAVFMPAAVAAVAEVVGGRGGGRR